MIFTRFSGSDNFSFFNNFNLSEGLLCLVFFYDYHSLFKTIIDNDDHINAQYNSHEPG